MPQPVIVSEGDGRTDRVLMLVATATVIKVGDLVYASVGKVYAVAASTADAKFQGIAGESSAASQSNSITVHTKCVVDVDVTSASYYVGAGLRWVSTDTLNDDGGANTLAWAHENFVGTVTTRLRVLIDVPRVRKLYTVDG